MNQTLPQTSPRVLVVEDTDLVAMLIETLIEDLGWTVIGPAANLTDALAAAQEDRIDAAVIDVNLNGEPSWRVATILRDRGVPFLFTTGYSDKATWPPGLEGSPVLGKPFQVKELERWLRGVVIGAS